MKTLTSFFTLLFSLVAYGAVPLGTVPYAQLDTNDFGVTVAGHINTRLGVHTPSTPGDTWYLTINGTNINNGGTNFLQSMNPTAGFFPVRGANTNFVDSLILQDATGLHVGTNFAGIIDYFGYPALTLGDTGGVNTYLTLYPDGLFLKDHYGNSLNLYGQTANIGGLIYGKSIMQLGTMWGKVELADDNPAHTAKFQPALPMGTSHTTLGSSTNAWEGIYAGSTKLFQFFDVIIDPGVSTNLNFAVDGVTYNIGAGGGSVGGTTINPTDYKVPYRLTAGSFGDTGMHPTNVNDMVFDGAVYLTTAAYDQNQFTNVDGVTYIRNQPRITNAILSQVITLDGLAYNFPTAHDRAGSVLMDYDNAGTLTWSGSITNPLYNIYLSNVWVNGTMASGVNPTRWKVPYNADGTNFLDTGMHPTNTTDVIFDGKIYSGADATLSLEKLTGYSWAFTTADGAGRSQIQFNNPNNGGNSFSVGATGGGAGELTTSGSSISMGLSGNLFTWQAGSFTASSPINFGGPLNANLSSWWSQTNFTKELVVTNGITLGGVRATAWPSGTVTYTAVTNALLATGSASDVLHGDGSWGAGGGGGEWTLVAGPPVGYLTPSTNLLIWGTPAPGSPYYAIGQSGNDLTFSASDGTDTVTLKANSTDGTTGLKIQTDGTYGSVDLTDGVDELLVQVDSGISAGGTGIFINSEDVLPFKRTGTDITTRTAGDSLTISGTGTNTTDTGWEAGFLTATNYIKALNATASRVAYIAADNTITNATSQEIQGALGQVYQATNANLTLVAADPAFTKVAAQTITNKVFASAAHSPTGGNALKQIKYMLLMRPDYGDGTKAVPQTNDFTASGLMHWTYAGDGETNTCWTVYGTAVPPDIDTSVEMTATFGFVSGGTDADDVTFHLTYALGAAGTALPTGTGISTSPIVMTITPVTPASGDVQQSAATTLTGWAASMTAGTPLFIRVARLNTANDDTARDLYLRISYGSTQ